MRLIAILIVVLVVAPALLAQNFDDLFGPPGRGPNTRLNFSVESAFARDIDQTNEEYAETGIRGSFSHKFLNNPGITLGVSTDFAYTKLEDTNGLLPEETFESSLGVNGRWGFSREFAMLGDIAVDTANDLEDVEASDYAVRILAMGMWRVSDSWTLLPGLYYLTRSINGSLPAFPVPVLQAAYIPSPRLQLILGLPFNQITYRPYDWFRFTASTFFLQNNNAEGAFRLYGENDSPETEGNPELNQLWLTPYFQTGVRNYSLTDETRYPKATFGDDPNFVARTLGAGAYFTWKPRRNFELELRYTYQFDTSFEYFNDDGDQIGRDLDADDGHTISASIKYAF